MSDNNKLRSSLLFTELFLCVGSVQREKFKGIKATSHLTIFDILMRPVREDQRHR